MKRKELRSESKSISSKIGATYTNVLAQESALIKQLKDLESQRAGVRVLERLTKTALVDVDLPGQSIRSGTLQNYGLVTLLDAQRYQNSLERLPNIGSVTANRIRGIINKVATLTPEDTRFYSDPSTWNSNDLAFVKTLVVLNRLKKTTSASDSFLKASELVRIAKRLRKKTGPIGYFLKPVREEAESLYQQIQEITPEEKREIIENDLSRMATSFSVGSLTDVETINEWRLNSADLLSLFDFVSPSAAQDASEISAERLAAGAPQLLPDSIQERIKSIQLNNKGFKRQLRTYQHFGARFILAAEGAILGDEMGLGKTMQALAVAHHLAQEKDVVHILVIAPVSILENWRRETEEATSFKIFMLYGKGRDERTEEWEEQGGIALTSYQTMRRLAMSEVLSVDLTIVDEAHKIKNPEAKQTVAALKVLKRSRYRLLLSGTPLENRASEFIFLSWLVNPKLGETLAKKFGDGSTAHLQASLFRRAIAPGYLRRNQSDVLQELPELLINNEMVMLESTEVELYRGSLREGNHASPRQAVSIGNGVKSSKMERLKELLEEYEAQGQKVLIFSSFLKVLDTVMEVAGPKALRMDGSVPTTERQKMVDNFSSREGFSVLAMQIEVGGVGLNIQAASVIIIIEPQWKPSTEWQAIGRSHRMGQTRRVNVHRLLAANTIDERIEERLQSKTMIFNAIVRPSHLAQEMNEATSDRSEESGLMSIVAEEAKRLSA